MTTLVAPWTADNVRTLVEQATLAPSAENLQPWHFQLQDEAVVLSLDRSRQLASDLDDMLGFVAIGACIENFVLAATNLGMGVDVDYLDNPVPTTVSRLRQPLARLVCNSTAAPHELAEYLACRCTTRRFAADRSISADLLRRLEAVVSPASGVQLHWVDPQRRKLFASLVGQGNRIRFEHQPFHQELYESFRFVAADGERARDGLDVDSLQLPPGLKQILWMLRRWPRMRWANRLGFSRGVARQAAQEVVHSGAVGFLSIPPPMPRNFIAAGRDLERLWLQATRLRLGFHPMASLPVFLAHARRGGEQLLPKHRAAAAAMDASFRTAFPELHDRSIAMAFRLGYGNRPAVVTQRRPLDQVLSQVRDSGGQPA